jgi:hypothetical protein
MLIKPTSCQVAEDPSLQGAALTLEAGWAWTLADGQVRSCADSAAAEALLDHIVVLEGELLDARRASSAFDALAGAVRASSLLDVLDSYEVQDEQAGC